MWRRFALIVALLLSACAEVPPAPAPEPVVEASPEAEAPTPKFKSDTLKYLAGRNLKPQPTRALNVKSRCSHRDAIGTATRLDLLVKQAEVKAFEAIVTMKGHGSCRFRLADFEQAEKLPQAVLRHKSEPGCLVRMWEQETDRKNRVTIAFNSCPKSCEGNAFEYLWPIMVEAKSGRCF